MMTSTKNLKVKIILPVYNEKDSIRALCTEIIEVTRAAGHTPSILLVNDGSTDGTREEMRSLSADISCVSYISLSRNFGKEAALFAGMREAEDDFDVLAYMDSDGQHDPADLIRMLDIISGVKDVQIVCGARLDRSYQSHRQRWFALKFYQLYHLLSPHRIEEGVGDFNLLSVQAVKTLRELGETHIFMKGLVSWIGYEKVICPITIRPRTKGTPKSSWMKMFTLGFGAILSFSSWPLRVWSVIGISSALLALTYLVFVVLQTLIMGRDIPGYATVVVLILGLGGLQLFSVGILGEYIARIYDASKNRPRYIVAERGRDSGHNNSPDHS